MQDAQTIRAQTAAVVSSSRWLAEQARQSLRASYWLMSHQRVLIRGGGGSPDSPIPVHPESPLLREKARRAIARKRMPNREPDHVSGMAGVGRNCSVCQDAITNETDLELRVERYVSEPAVYHAHVRCFAAWMRTLRDHELGDSWKKYPRS